MTNGKPVSNEQILKEVQDMAQNLRDFMQMTSERFDKVDERFDRLEKRADNTEGELKELRSASYRQETNLDNLADIAKSTRVEVLNLHADIGEILDRLVAIEKRLPAITESEIRKLQAEMQAAIDWIARVSKLNDIPVKFPS